ncbi:hypothetical protein Tco_1390896 [Tanacetum coccineum]
MHLRNRGGHVHGIKSENQGNNGMFGQGRSCFKPVIPKVSKRCTKVEWKASKPKQIPFQISRKKSLSFFKTLKKCTKKSDFQWTAESEAAFKEMKKLIAELPTLTAPMEREELIVYLAAVREAILSRPEVAGRLQKWSIELVERPEDDPLDTPMEAEEELPDPWTLFTDGSSCVDGSGVGLILTNPEGAEFTYAMRFRFDVTNNDAE